MTLTPHGDKPLNNQEAREVADKIFNELWREFHPMATRKVISNLDRIHVAAQRENTAEFQRKQDQERQK